MHKKLMTACMALVAFAALAVMPAVASATNDPDLTHPTGTPLAPGAKITATNIGETLMTDANTNILTRCTKAVLTGELTKNNGTEVEGSVTSASFTGSGSESRCTATFGDSIITPTVPVAGVAHGLPWCIRSTPAMGTDEVQVRGGKCSEASRDIRFILDVFGGATECEYQRTTAIPGTYTTEPSDAIVHISEQKFSRIRGSSFICPSEGFLDMSFTLETDTPTADPLYFS